jgi:hypothetical protein
MLAQCRRTDGIAEKLKTAVSELHGADDLMPDVAETAVNNKAVHA